MTKIVNGENAKIFLKQSGNNKIELGTSSELPDK